MENTFEVPHTAKKRLRKKHSLYFYSGVVIPDLNARLAKFKHDGDRATNTGRASIQGNRTGAGKHVLVWECVDRSLT